MPLYVIEAPVTLDWFGNFTYVPAFRATLCSRDTVTIRQCCKLNPKLFPHFLSKHTLKEFYSFPKTAFALNRSLPVVLISKYSSPGSEDNS